jgi:hypothetical protein
MQGRDEPLRLELVTSGDVLVGVMAAGLSYVHRIPAHLSARQRELVGDFLQSAQDWAEIHGDIGPKGHMEAGQHLQDRIDALRQEGLVVYAATRPLTLVSSAADETPWPESVVHLVHEDEARKSPEEAAATEQTGQS